MHSHTLLGRQRLSAYAAPRLRSVDGSIRLKHPIEQLTACWSMDDGELGVRATLARMYARARLGSTTGRSGAVATPRKFPELRRPRLSARSGRVRAPLTAVRRGDSASDTRSTRTGVLRRIAVPRVCAPRPCDRGRRVRARASALADVQG